MKKWYHSRLFWVNLLSLVAMVIQGMGYVDVATEFIAMEATILSIVNLILRLRTNQGLVK